MQLYISKFDIFDNNKTKLSEFTLVDKKQLINSNKGIYKTPYIHMDIATAFVVMVDVPDDIKIDKIEHGKLKYTTYTAHSDVSIDELNPNIYIKVNGKYEYSEYFTELFNKHIQMMLFKMFDNNDHYVYCNRHIGFLEKDFFDRIPKKYIEYLWRFRKIPDEITDENIPKLTKKQTKVISDIKEMLNKDFMPSLIRYDDGFIYEYREENYDDSNIQYISQCIVSKIRSMSDDTLAFICHKYKVPSFNSIPLVSSIMMNLEQKTRPFVYMFLQHLCIEMLKDKEIKKLEEE